MIREKFKAIFLKIKQLGFFAFTQRMLSYINKRTLTLIAKSMSPIVIFFTPSYLNYLSFGLNKGSLPSKNDRLDFSSDLLDDFSFINISQKENFREVNLIFRGKFEGDIDKSLPTFFLNPMHSNEIRGFKEKWLITADDNVLRTYLGEYDGNGWDGYRVGKSDEKIYFIYTNKFFLEFNKRNNISDYTKETYQKLNHKLKKMVTQKNDFDSSFVFHKSGLPNIKLGSGLISIVALLNISKKVNVYGWDQYIDRNMPNRFYSQVMLLWPLKSFTFFATCLNNWIYCHRFLNNQHSGDIVINGKLSQIKNIAWISDKAYKVIYNSSYKKV